MQTFLNRFLAVTPLTKIIFFMVMLSEKDGKAGFFANTGVQRLTNNNFHSWKITPNVLLKSVGGVSLFHSNLALSDACKRNR